MSNVWTHFSIESENHRTLAKKALTFFCFILKISTFQMFYIKYKIETSDRFFSTPILLRILKALSSFMIFFILPMVKSKFIAINM